MLSVNQIKGQLASASSNTSSALTDSQIKEAEELFQSKLSVYRQTLTEKALLYDTLLSQAK